MGSDGFIGGLMRCIAHERAWGPEDGGMTKLWYV